MREILFRAKTESGKWCYGDLITADWYSNEKTYILQLGQQCQVIEKTVGQYTGLTDKNGNKIFEGDIVAYETNTNRATNKEIHEVVFETRGGNAYFGIKISDIETWLFCLEVPAKLMKVIGNIHDNPELLKEAEQE